jgi:hypothetical protein
MSSKPQNLRRALALRNRARKRRYAHTASGKDIRGFWEWFERIVLMFTFASIVMGVIAFGIDYEDRKQARAVNQATLEEIEASREDRKEAKILNAATLAEIEAAREERTKDAIARAWTLVTTPATGNSGKGPALEYLNGQGIPLTGIDLSCERMGGGWDAQEQTCASPTYLRGVNLPKANLIGARLQGASLREAQLQGADLAGAQLQGADLSQAQLQGASLRDAQLQGAYLWLAQLQDADLWLAQLQGANLAVAQLQGADLMLAQLQGANLSQAQLQGAYLSGAQLQGAYLSGADFTDAVLDDTITWRDPETGLAAWARADTPPIGLDLSLIDLCVYDPEIVLLLLSTRPDPCVPPEPAE